MPERSGTAVPRRSVRPTVQPETSPSRRAKSTTRTTSPTQHIRPPPGFCHFRSVRLEQFPERCPQSELRRSIFRATAKDIFVRTILTHLAYWGEGFLVMRYTDPHNNIGIDISGQRMTSRVPTFELTLCSTLSIPPTWRHCFMHN